MRLSYKWDKIKNKYLIFKNDFEIFFCSHGIWTLDLSTHIFWSSLLPINVCRLLSCSALPRLWRSVYKLLIVKGRFFQHHGLGVEEGRVQGGRRVSLRRGRALRVGAQKVHLEEQVWDDLRRSKPGSSFLRKWLLILHFYSIVKWLFDNRIN